MDNIGIVVDSLDDAISFLTELGLTLRGEPWLKKSGPDASRDWVISASKLP
jgi:hypothetical protein